jgi:hypothetical protein
MDGTGEYQFMYFGWGLKANNILVFFFFLNCCIIIYCCAGWGYIGVFAKVLTM